LLGNIEQFLLNHSNGWSLRKTWNLDILGVNQQHVYFFLRVGSFLLIIFTVIPTLWNLRELRRLNDLTAFNETVAGRSSTKVIILLFVATKVNS
jgi:hypothetical protein